MNEPQAPATKRQLWALFCITKEDHRSKGLSREQASELIQKLSAIKEQQVPQKMNKDKMAQKLYEYFISRMDEIVEVIDKQLGIKSIITGHIGTQKSQTFNFVGSGCGFAWLDYDKRNKVVKSYFEYDNSNTSIAHSVIEKVKKVILKDKFDEKTRFDYIAKGIPLEATMCQNMEIQIIFYRILADYLQITHGAKNIKIQSRLD